jgi:prepilin-type N-terminal cleavage/methylation domain-containing protein
MRKCRKMKKLRLNCRARRAFQGSSRGFTLLEVLISIALIGIVAVAILSALSTSSKVVSSADERTTAESLARRQIEYVKSQDYNSTESVLNETIYQKISDIPAGYSIWSVNRAGAVIANIVGIPWDSQNNKPADKDAGLQKIALVIKHKDTANQDKTIYTFINTNSYWAYNVPITLEAYKVNR